ncbi:MAG: hypothetical protein ABID09_03675, partial [Candidatus Omnitrophota bacterium]
QVGTITPSSGTSYVNQSITFTTTYTDLDGYQDLKSAIFLVNTKGVAKTGVCAYYNVKKNRLYLLKQGSGYIGGYKPGSANTITNDYATLDCSKTTVTGSGNTLTIKWNIPSEMASWAGTITLISMLLTTLIKIQVGQR